MQGIQPNFRVVTCEGGLQIVTEAGCVWDLDAEFTVIMITPTPPSSEAKEETKVLDQAA